MMDPTGIPAAYTYGPFQQTQTETRIPWAIFAIWTVLHMTADLPIRLRMIESDADWTVQMPNLDELGDRKTFELGK